MTMKSMITTFTSGICMVVGALHILTEGGNIEIGCTVMIISMLMLVIAELQDIKEAIDK